MLECYPRRLPARTLAAGAYRRLKDRPAACMQAVEQVLGRRVSAQRVAVARAQPARRRVVGLGPLAGGAGTLGAAPRHAACFRRQAVHGPAGTYLHRQRPRRAHLAVRFQFALNSLSVRPLSALSLLMR